MYPRFRHVVVVKETLSLRCVSVIQNGRDAIFGRNLSKFSSFEEGVQKGLIVSVKSRNCCKSRKRCRVSVSIKSNVAGDLHQKADLKGQDRLASTIHGGWVRVRTLLRRLSPLESVYRLRP
jgi:hypothetical protein